MLKTCAGYLFLALQAMSSASISIILSSGIPSRLTVLKNKKKEKKRKEKKTAHLQEKTKKENFMNWKKGGNKKEEDGYLYKDKVLAICL